MLAKTNGACARCGSHNGVVAHHIVPVATGGAALDVSNGEPLCGSCHAAAHGVHF